MDFPLISIITPSYNQVQFIEKTIESVLDQTYPNIEYIVIDGESTDGSVDIIEKYRSKINIIVIEIDKGQSDAINKGFKLAKGDLVGWINSDDILAPNCVEEIARQYKLFPNGAIFFGSRIETINQDSNRIGVINHIIKSRNHLLIHDYDVMQPGSFYNRKILKKIGYIDDSLHFCMDLDLWLRLLNYGSIHSFDKYPLAKFRIWGMTKTSQGGRAFIKEIRKTLRKNGAKLFYPTVMKTYWQEMKLNIKQSLKL